MTPQESQLVEDLFDRLATLETQPRDATAERLIADGAARAPHALYALVQTALVQDEALKRANARIEELQTQVQAQVEGEPQPEPRQTSFLDSMREAFGGGSQQRGSVPSVRTGAAPQAPYQQQAQPGYAPQMPSYGTPPFGGGGSPGGSSGGSFLGTAASAAAGVVGGALLLDGIRSMFGHSSSAYARNAFGDLPERASPWDNNTSGSAADSDLARQAGIDHIGDAARNDANAGSGNANDLFANNDDDANNGDADDSDDNFGSDDDFGDADAGADSGGSYDV
jgi:uncharacterized protein